MGAVLLSLGIVGSYVFRVFQEVLGRPRYLLTDSVDREPLGGGDEEVSSVPGSSSRVP